MKYFWGIVCFIMWFLFMIDKVSLDRPNLIFGIIFSLLGILFINCKREDE